MIDTIPLTIGTRCSPLSLVQANLVKSLLEHFHKTVRVQIVKIKTTGDKRQDVRLSEIGGKALFTKELDIALYEGRCDIAVHSMKDVETQLPEHMEIPCILPRADIRDAVVSNSGQKLLDLPTGAVIGTSSVRRQVQLLKMRPDFRIVPFRGNVDTRLKKLQAGQADAILLALAGLKRLNLQSAVTEILEPDSFIPSIAQGTIGIQCKSEVHHIKELLKPLNCQDSFDRVCCERAMLRALGGNCKTPVGGYAVLTPDDTFHLTAFASTEEGKVFKRVQGFDRRENGEKLGTKLGMMLRDHMGCDFFTH